VPVSLYDLHSPESYHQQRQDDICELYQSHWQVKGQQMKDLGGESFDVLSGKRIVVRNWSYVKTQKPRPQQDEKPGNSPVFC
jgi:hypothetical protein